MSWLVIFDWENFTRTAVAFSSRNDAVDYINCCISTGSSIIQKVDRIDKNFHILRLYSNEKIWVTIREVPQNSIKYDILFTKNSQYIETRRFSRRSLAVKHAHKILDELDAEPSNGEDVLGLWILKDTDRNLEATIECRLVLLDGSVAKSDYVTLGVTPDATDDEIKQAYRKMSKKYHPDVGGDSKKFEELHDAYERIKSGNGRLDKKAIKERYSSVNIKRVFRDRVVDTKTKITVFHHGERLTTHDAVRGKAATLVFRGFILACLGGLLTLVSCSMAESNKPFTVFYGAVGIGIYDFIRGLYYLVNPEAMLNKANKKPREERFYNKPLSAKAMLAIFGVAAVVMIFIAVIAQSDPYTKKTEITERLNEVLTTCLKDDTSSLCSELKSKYKIAFEYCYSYADIPEIGKNIPIYGVARLKSFKPIELLNTNSKDENRLYPYYGCANYVENMNIDDEENPIKETETLALYMLSEVPKWEAFGNTAQCETKQAVKYNAVWKDIPNLKTYSNKYDKVSKKYAYCGELEQLKSEYKKINKKLSNYANSPTVQLFFKGYDDFAISRTALSGDPSCKYDGKSFTQVCPSIFTIKNFADHMETLKISEKYRSRPLE